MDVVITEWALQSYITLKARNVFTAKEYKEVLRPDAELKGRPSISPREIAPAEFLGAGDRPRRQGYQGWLQDEVA